MPAAAIDDDAPPGIARSADRVAAAIVPPLVACHPDPAIHQREQGAARAPNSCNLMVGETR
jgi:hypothetical protein